jgi:hypothetical protein
MVRLYGSAGLDASAPERATLARQRARAAGVWRLVPQEEQERERARRPTPQDLYVSSTRARLFLD